MKMYAKFRALIIIAFRKIFCIKDVHIDSTIAQNSNTNVRVFNQNSYATEKIFNTNICSYAYQKQRLHLYKKNTSLSIYVNHAYTMISYDLSAR